MLTRDRITRALSRRSYRFVTRWRHGEITADEPLDFNRCGVYGNARVTLGRHSYASGFHVYGWHGERLTIGKFCSIADGISIILGGTHRLQFASTSPMPWRLAGLPEEEQHADMTIGNDVWIGHGVTILPGCDIGDGAVLATGAVVTNPVAPYAIMAGIPAKLIGYRFEQPLRDQLRALAWWDWPDDLIAARASEMEHPAALVERYG